MRQFLNKFLDTVGLYSGAPDHEIKQCIERSASFPGMAGQGPERQSAEGSGVLGRGAIAPPHYWVWGRYAARKIILKNQGC